MVVVGKSMAPSLHEGDRRLVNRWAVRVFGVTRGDLVVLREPSDSIKVIKRIVGLPRDRTQLRIGSVYVNGRKLKEQYLAAGNQTYSSSLPETGITLGPDEYFVLGDNRLHSLDSRHYGAVRKDNLIGRVE
jgi:signal peptidase I